MQFCKNSQTNAEKTYFYMKEFAIISKKSVECL